GKKTALASGALGAACLILTAGCDNTIRTHPPTQTRIEQMQEQLRQMEDEPAASDAESEPPMVDEAQQ
ncbi:MAG: hypothetical protein JSV91_00345, partial [Phycisphaerales bacterium]